MSLQFDPHPMLAMSKVMDVLGVVALVAILLILVGIFLIVRFIFRLKSAFKEFGEHAKEFGKIAQQGVVPDSLGLMEVDENELLDDPALLSARRELETAGMKFGGAYRLEKMPSVLLATFADPSRSVTAAVANAGGFGMTVDVVSMYEDGSAVTHRTLKSLGLDYPPHFTHVHVPDGKPAEVLARHLAERDTTKPLRTFDPEDVADAMEEYNSIVVRWKTQRGGLTEDEVRRSMMATGTEADEDSIKMVVAASRIEADRRRENNDDGA